MALVTTDHLDDRPMLWDVGRAARLATLSHDVDFLEEVTFSHDGRALDHGRRLLVEPDLQRRWALAGSRRLQGCRAVGRPSTAIRGHAGPPQQPVFSADSRLLATASGFPTEVAIWRVEDRARVATLNVGDVGGQALRFSPDSRLLAARGKDGVTVQRFDAPGRHNISAPSSGGTSPGRNGTPRPRSRLPEGLPMTPAARGPR